MLWEGSRKGLFISAHRATEAGRSSPGEGCDARSETYNRSPMKLTRLLFCGGVLCAAAFAQDRVMQEALRTDSPLYENLRVLTDEIGGRVPGTPQMTAAEQWAVERFKQAGADSVHLEEFTIPASWSEGATEVNIVAPTEFHVRATSIAWTPALAKTTARVVSVGMGSAEEFAKAGDISGAIVLVNSHVNEKWIDLFNEYFNPPPIIARAIQGHALALAFTATREHDILYRHIDGVFGEIAKIPEVLLAREDALRIQRILASGKPVKMSLSLPNKVGGKITAHNVVADLKGSELPNEVVILGAHLDSWNLGTGALDNGCNAALTIDSLRAIKAAGVKPRRTLRFILFAGEEQGILGSWAYVRAHRGELDNVQAVVVVDSGVGQFNGWATQGHKEVMEPLKALVAPFAQWNATAITEDAELGTDNYDFMMEGVPTILPDQPEFNYLPNYHAISDTFDKVDFEQLRKNEAMSAELMVELANLPERIGRRYHRKEIEASFADTHFDEQMKGFGAWEAWVDGTRGRKD